MTPISSLVVFVTLAGSVLATGDPAVVKPAAGAHIKPGTDFDFQYNSLADYCASSYNLTVWLFTSAPTSSAPSRTWATGYYFGRFGVENYPGNPYPPNPVPVKLFMPDFSKSAGGFAASGYTASNLPVYLAVLEEWGSCQAVAGDRLALSYHNLVYNGTNQGAS